VSLTVDSDGCSNTATSTALVTVLAKPHAAFTYTPNTKISQDTLVVFQNQTTGAVTYNWNFGESPNSTGYSTTSSTDENPTHTFADSAKYKVMLIATASSTCVDTSIQYLTVLPRCNWPGAIPNVFSPNNDAKNDEFVVASEGLSDLTCTIYNRWGTEVFSYDAKNGNWDGRVFNGGVAPEGTYYCLFKATCLVGGKKNTHEGFLQLVR